MGSTGAHPTQMQMLWCEESRDRSQQSQCTLSLPSVSVPKKDREQLAIHYASKHSLPFKAISHLYWVPSKLKALFVAKEQKEKDKGDNSSKDKEENDDQ